MGLSQLKLQHSKGHLTGPNAAGPQASVPQALSTPTGHSSASPAKPLLHQQTRLRMACSRKLSLLSCSPMHDPMRTKRTCQLPKLTCCKWTPSGQAAAAVKSRINRNTAHPTCTTPAWTPFSHAVRPSSRHEQVFLQQRTNLHALSHSHPTLSLSPPINRKAACSHLTKKRVNLGRKGKAVNSQRGRI